MIVNDLEEGRVAAGYIPITSGDQYVPLFLTVPNKVQMNPGGGPIMLRVAIYDVVDSFDMPEGGRDVIDCVQYKATTLEKVQKAYKLHKKKDLSKFVVMARGFLKNDLMRQFDTPLPTSYTTDLPKQMILYEGGGVRENSCRSEVAANYFLNADTDNFSSSYAYIRKGLLASYKGRSYNYLKSSALYQHTNGLKNYNPWADIVPRILVVVKAKYVNMIRVNTTLGIPFEIPFDAIRVLRYFAEYESSVMSNYIFTVLSYGLSTFMTKHQLKEEWVDLATIKSYLFTEPTSINKEEYIKRVLAQLDSE